MNTLDEISLADLELEERLTLAAISRSSFEDFVKTFWEYVPGAGMVKWNWHLSVFCDELQRIAERVFAKLPKEHDLVCNCPPGTSKSTIWSILFPAWVWTRMPECRILTASHTTDLVYDLASKSRDVIESELYQQLFPNIHIREDTNAKGHYRNDHGGERKVCTVAGKSPMGFHAHIVLTDDPIDPKKVLSEVELANAKQFVDETVISRVTDKERSVIVLVMQRLGLGDPTDVILQSAKREGAYPVRHVCLPAELEVGDDGGFSDVGVSPPEYAKQYIDGLLDPVRLSARALAAFKSRGPLYYATQFLQRPFAREGGQFHMAWFYKRPWVKVAPYDAKRIRYVDRAACLVAGTLVETLLGPKPIERIQAGEYVLTREGYRPVKWAGVSGVVREVASVLFSNGSVVTGTLDHPVWDEREGWVDLATLDGGSYNIALVQTRGPICLTNESENGNHCQVRKRFGSMGGFTIARRESDITGAAGNPCTELFGNSITGISPLAVKFITKTRTGITTRSKILNALPQPSIIGRMAYSGAGMERRKLLLIINESAGQDGKPFPVLSLSPANFAGSESGSARRGLRRSSAPPFAAVDIDWTSRSKFVSCVNGSFGGGRGRGHVATYAPIDTGWPNAKSAVKSFCEGNLLNDFAQRAVERSGSIPVYDLVVEGCHEFFANGVLVHNTEQGGCYTAGVLLAYDGVDVYIEHVYHGQWGPEDRNDRIVARAKYDKMRYGPKHDPILYIEAERGSTGEESFRNLARKLPGYRVREDMPSGKKDVRAEPWADALAAGTVVIVDDGTWDVEEYIREHVAFKLQVGTTKRYGKYKDQVDASSGAYNLLIGKQMATGGFRILRPRSDNKTKVRVCVLTRERLAMCEVADREFLMVLFDEPEGVMCNGRSDDAAKLPTRSDGSVDAGAVDAQSLSPRGGVGEITPLQPPPHLLKLLDSPHTARFADLEPAELQDQWDQELPAYGRKPGDVVMSRDDGKKLWAYLLKRRPAPVTGVVFVANDEQDRRAMAVALAYVDTLGLPRGAIWSGDDEEKHDGKAANAYCYDLMKSTRGMVV